MSVSLSYTECGNPKNGTIVAFHGVTDNGASLSDIAEHWRGEWQVRLVDLLGHGNSPHFTVDQLKDPFSALVNSAVDIVYRSANEDATGKVVIYGHSLGGAVAAHIAAKNPSLVRALILDDPALLTDDQYQMYLDGGPLLAERQDLISKHVGEAMLELMKVYKNWPISEYGAWAQGKTQVDRNFVRTGIVGARNRTVLAELKVPTILITGEGDDVLFGEEGLKEVSQYGNSNIDLALIPQATHTVRRDNPDAFYTIADKFLAELSKEKTRDPYIKGELKAMMLATPTQDIKNYQDLRASGDKVFGDSVPKPDDIDIEVVQIKSDGELSLRFIHKLDADAKKIIVSLHGGAFVAGRGSYDDLRNFDLVSELADALVCVPEYRLAPEDSYPAAVRDCLACIVYLKNKYPDLPMYLYGDSAGAGIAVQTLQMLAKLGDEYEIDGFICLEPCIDPRLATKSYKVYENGPIWTTSAAQSAWNFYLGDVPENELLLPVEQVAKIFPPTIIFANSVDPLRDEAVSLATKIIDGGGQAELHMLAGTIHGGLSVVGTRTWATVRRLISEFINDNNQKEQ